MKEKHLFFIRHSKLLLPYKNHSEMPFKVLADLASEKLNPSIDEQFTLSKLDKLLTKIPFKNLEKIYTSPSRRCQTTAKIIKEFIAKKYKKEIRVTVLSELIEIQFDLDKIYHHQIKNNLNIEDINDRVFLEMIKGEKCESIVTAYKRIAFVFNKIDKSKTSLLVTHDFFMRIIEIYIKNQGKDTPVITYNIMSRTQKNGYLHGFRTDIHLSEFSSL